MCSSESWQEVFELGLGCWHNNVSDCVLHSSVGDGKGSYAPQRVQRVGVERGTTEDRALTFVLVEHPIGLGNSWAFRGPRWAGSCRMSGFRGWMASF